MEKYLERKEKGLVKVIKSGDTALMLISQFDPFTGEEISPQSLQLNLAQIQEEKEKLNQQLADLDALLEDINNTN